MNISGTSTDNTHNGNTRILGDLEVDGNIVVDNALGQSEYLDSGEYKSVISNISGITNVAFDSLTRTYYEKQGNLVKLYTTLKITFTSVLAPTFQFNITVPALDIFEKKINGAFCIASGSFFNQYDCDSFANVLNTDGTVDVIYQRLPLSNVNLPFGGDAYASLTLVYKLVGDDIPATVLLAGGSGSGDVKNPMLETLNGGGFNIVNVDSIVANSITASNVVTNPLSVNLNANNKNITNVNSLEAVTLGATNTNTIILAVDTITTVTAPNVSLSNNIDMKNLNIRNVSNTQSTSINTNNISAITPATSINVNNNIDMNGYDILFPSNISGVSNIENTTLPMTIKGNPLYLQSQTPGTGIKVDDNFDFQYPLNSTINNCNEIKTVGQQLRIVGGPLILENDSGATDIFISNSIDMNGRDIKDVGNTTTTNIFTNSISTISPTTQLNVNNEVNFTNKNILNINDVQSNNTLTNAIYPRTPAQPIQIYEDTVYNEKSIFQLAGIINAGLQLIVNTGSVYFSETQILEPGLIQKTGTLTFDSASSYNFLNYVDFTTKRLNTIKFIRSEADFQNLASISGLYVIIGNVTITTQNMTITGPTTISGYNSLSKLIFNIPTLSPVLNCINNVAGSAQNLYIQDIEINKISSEGAGIFSLNDNNKTRTIRLSNILFKDCNLPRFAVFMNGWRVVEILNNTFINVTGGASSAIVRLDNCDYSIIESNEFIENVFSSPCIAINAICNYVNINNNTIITNGATSIGVEVYGSATIERIIITDNIFNAINGALPSNLLIVNTQIHKGLICNDNTNVDPCNAALEGLVNGNVVYTTTVLNTWVPVDLTGFTVGTISRFVPTLNPYEFAYDGKDPIRCLINVNCQADHSTGGVDTVQLGLSQNGTVNVFVQAELSSGQASQVAITTVVTANFGDTFQIVTKNITAGSNTNGFRAQSLNASLVEV